MKRVAGFTLIEMLVAVAIFALAAGLAYGGLRELTRAREQLQQQSQRLQQLQFAIGLIERDLRAAIDRPVRDAYGAELPAVQASTTRIELSRIGRGNALAAPRADIERVAYQLDGEQLQRLHFSVLDRAAGSVPDVQPLLDGVSRLQFRMIDAGGRDLDQWPPPRADDTQSLPRAIEVRLTLTDEFGEVRRLLELPAGPREVPR